MITELTNHLWQSTLFAVAAALLTLAFRSNRASVRYWIWLSASLKFLVPFLLLMNAGSHIWREPQSKAVTTQALSVTITQIAQPFHHAAQIANPAPRPLDWVPSFLLGLWMCGAVFIVAIRVRSCIQIRAAIRSSNPMDLVAAIPVRCAPGLLEPGVVGLLRPILLMPADITERLEPAQLKAVIAHEMCHARRRDNVTAALHMLVETLFWFHPLVWWVGARLMDERERACDEAVLSEGCEPGVYAEGIVRICRSYTESPLLCAPGVTGANLKKRIRTILTGHIPGGLTWFGRLVLTGAATGAIAGPVVVGVMRPAVLTAQFRSGPTPKFAAAFITSCADGPSPTRTGGRGGTHLGAAHVSVDAKGNFVIPNTPTKLLVSCEMPANLIKAAYAIFADGHLNQSLAEHPERVRVEGPAWITSERYQLDAAPESPQEQDTINGPMLQGLLEDRFQLRIHRETRAVPGYVLSVASGGFKAPPFREGECLPVNFGQFKAALTRVRFSGLVLEPMLPQNFCPNRGGELGTAIQIEARGVTVDEFADSFLSSPTGPIVNRTGIKGLYDFRLEFEPDDAARAHRGAGLALSAALEAQLGLKLESMTVQQEVLVVDSVQRPVQN